MDSTIKIIAPDKIMNRFFHLIGGIFLILNFIRHNLFGYRTPRDFSNNEIDKVVEYDFKIVENWAAYLSLYTEDNHALEDKTILEIGPGADLGVSLILLALGIKEYISIDVNDLASSAPVEIYKQLYKLLKDKYPLFVLDANELNDNSLNRNSSRIKYIVDKEFNIAKINKKADIVFSNAAFEHLDDVNQTIKELSGVIGKNGVLIAEVDLKTHTSWIRDRDPLNIYRYSDLFWNLFSFKGSPNRIRGFEFKQILEKNGWGNIEIVPLVVLEEDYFAKIRPSLNSKFKDVDPQEMKMLSIMLMAKKL